MRAKPLTSIELFTGAGGLALGTANAGFEHQLLLEYNRDACSTLRVNHKLLGEKSEIHEGDVKTYSFARFKDVDLLVAGAPCQPFSIAGKHRTHEDERNLFPQAFRAIREVRPKAVVIENVRGLLRRSLQDFVEYVELQLSMPDATPAHPLDASSWLDHLPVLRRLRRQRGFTGDEYAVQHVLLNAADYGVPQVRERVFFVAIRLDCGAHWQPPRPTHSRQSLLYAQHVSGDYWRRHGLKRRATASHPLAGRWLREGGRTNPWVTVRDALVGLPEPIMGRGCDAWLNHVGQAGARSYPGHTGSPFDWPAKTLKAGVHGVPGGENMLRRPNGTVRYFTVREAARLQAFPDDYGFSGAWGESLRQVGNAVPVRLAAVVAQSVAACLASGAGALQRQPGQFRPEAQQVEIPEFLPACV